MQAGSNATDRPFPALAVTPLHCGKTEDEGEHVQLPVQLLPPLDLTRLTLGIRLALRFTRSHSFLNPA